MSMPRGLIFVIGPSSVGKSHLCAKAAAELRLPHHDLDAELGDPGLRTWSLVQGWLDAVTAPALVDVGAGTQHSCGEPLTAYLAERADRVILVTDDPERAFERNVVAGHRRLDDLDRYLEVEFRQRQALYGVAPHVVDYKMVGLDDALTLFVTLVRALART